MPNLNRLNEILTQNLTMNKARITCLSLTIIADREFVGERWFNWLTNTKLPFTIRIKKNSKVMNHHGKLVQIKELFRHDFR